MRRSILLVLPACLLACTPATPPENEPPVDLKTGLYEVTLGGGTMIALANDQRTHRYCIAPDAAFNFPHDPLATLVKHWDGCVDSAEPVGNALKGTRSCPDRKTPVNVSYAGRHDDHSFVFEGVVMQGSDETASVSHLGSGEFRIAGERVGDCY